MAILRFRVFWEDDDQTYRDIELLAGQTFMDFHQAIVKAFEFDGQQTSNEPGSYAVRSAIELGVAELIKSGEKKGLWHYKSPTMTTTK